MSRQQVNNKRVYCFIAVVNGKMQRRPALIVPGIDIRSFVQEDRTMSR